jgi:metal-responsive CopG/Arc/MetJ family transcriptional regulator
MKTAISIPDDLFEAADQLAKGIGVSRSQLYTRAVESFVREHSREDVTERINRVLERTSSELDPFWVAAQARVFRDDR